MFSLGHGSECLEDSLSYLMDPLHELAFKANNFFCLCFSFSQDNYWLINVH